MKDENKLINGSPLLIEDLSCTLQVRTFQMPVRYGFFKRMWKNLTCKHIFVGTTDQTRIFLLLSADEAYCSKCGTVRGGVISDRG